MFFSDTETSPKYPARRSQKTRRDSGEVPRRGPEQSREAQSLYSPLSVTREREKTDEGEAQTETEAPERPQSKTFSLLDIKEDRERKERARASQRSPERQRREMPRRKLRRGPRV